MIILINGKKRAGKDFFAKALKKEFKKRGKTAEIMAFADPIKEIISLTFGISLETLDNYKNKKYRLYTQDGDVIIDFRQIMQRFGTEAMQTAFGPRVWVDKLIEKAYNSNADYIIVPDFRFKQEDISDFKVYIYDESLIDSDAHKSENDLNDTFFEFTVDNTGHPDLQEAIETYCDYVLNTGTE